MTGKHDEGFPTLIITKFPATAVVTRRFVKLSGAQCDTAGEAAYGVAVIDADAGGELSVVKQGLAVVEAGAAITAPALLTTTAAGKAITATAGQKVNAVAMEDAAGDGSFLKVEVIPPIQTASPSVLIVNTTNTIAVTAAQLGSAHTRVIASVAGTAALAIPDAGTVPAGTPITVKKTGSAGAVTITPGAGTIAGGATHAALDAQNDWATFVSDGVSDWMLAEANIA